MFLGYKDFNALVLHVVILATYARQFNMLHKDCYTIWFFLVFTFFYDLVAVIWSISLCCCGNNI